MRVAALLSIMAICSGCTPSDDERCGDGFVWSAADSTCYPVDEDTDTGAPDAGGDAGAEGLGATCTESGGECSGIYDYCLLQPGADTGYCTMDDCTVSPDDCPATYHCCDFSFEGVPNCCVNEDDWELLGSMCLS